MTGVGRKTVRRALAAEGPPKYQRPVRGSKVDAVEPQIRELLRAYPRMPATVMAERIGWTFGILILTQYLAGELAQRDLWFPAGGYAARIRAGGSASGVGDGLWVFAGDKSVAFATAAQWDRLAAAHHGDRLQDEPIKLGRVPLLIIDEVGYIPFEPEAANLFFQLISTRSRASLIVTSNKPFGRWGEVCGDDIVAAAMIDRLVHHAKVLSLKDQADADTHSCPATGPSQQSMASPWHTPSDNADHASPGPANRKSCADQHSPAHGAKPVGGSRLRSISLLIRRTVR